MLLRIGIFATCFGPPRGQRGLLWMDGPAEPGKTFVQNSQHPSSVFLAREAHDKSSSPGESHSMPSEKPELNGSSHYGSKCSVAGFRQALPNWQRSEGLTGQRATRGDRQVCGGRGLSFVTCYARMGYRMVGAYRGGVFCLAPMLQNGRARGCAPGAVTSGPA